MALTAQYLNVRQRGGGGGGLGTISIQTVHILQHDTVSAATGSMLKHNPNYFQTTQPSTVTPPYSYQWLRLSLINHFYSESGSFVETSLFPEPTGAPLEFQPIALTAQAVIALHSTRQLNQVG